MKMDLTNRNALIRVLPLMMIGLMTACGGGGGDGGTTNPPANQAPSADAGESQIVDEGTEVALTGSGEDSDGTIASWSWTQTAGPAVTLTDADSATPGFTAPDVDGATTLTFELAVTDDAGDSATDTVNVDVAPVIALSGTVYDGPIPNAVVTVTIDGRSYTATADENGVYTLNIGAIDPAAFVTIGATGGEGQEHVELMSIAGSFGALSEAAGDDGVLETSESGNVNVTNLSTAKAVLMIEANGGADISDDATLATAESNVSGDDVLYLATVIKLVIDGGYDLPAGVGSTLDLVKDSTTTEAFVDAVDADDPAAFESNYDSIINDPALVAAFTANNVPSTMFTLFVSTVNDKSLTYRVTNRGKAWTFNTDGRGTRSDADYASAPFDWTIADGKIVVTYDTPLQSAGWCTHPDGDEGWTYWCEGTTSATAITLVVDGTTADTLLLSSTGVTTYPDDGLPDVEMTGGSTNLGLQASAAIPFTADEVPGRWIASTSGRADPAVAAVMTGLLDSGFLEFQSGGAGERTATDHTAAEGFTWSITDGVLKVAFVGGDIVHYYRLRRDGGVYDTLALLTRSENGKHSDAGLMLEVEVEKLPLLSAEDIPARYTLFEMENDFSIRFAAIGTGSSEAYNEGVPYDTFPFQWILRDDYVVQMSYFWDEILGIDTDECSDVTACHLYLDRLWNPAAYDEETGRVYLLEIQQRYLWDEFAEFHQGGLEYYQPSVRYWGRSELAEEPVISKTSAPAATSSADRMTRVLAAPTLRNR